MLFMQMLEILDEPDRELVERLYNDYSSKVKAIAIKILKNEVMADDAVNDTFLKVIRYVDKFVDVPEKERIRLITIYARSACFSIMKKTKNQRADSVETYTREDGECVEFDIPDNVDILGEIIKEETIVYLMNELNTMESPVREMVIMTSNGIRSAEIAEIYDMNASTVRTNIQRGRERLKRRLEEYINGENK